MLLNTVTFDQEWVKHGSNNRRSRPEVFFEKGVLKKFHKIHRKTPASESLFS